MDPVITCFSLWVRMEAAVWRVVCTLGGSGQDWIPQSELTRVLFPAFGTPEKQKRY